MSRNIIVNLGNSIILDDQWSILQDDQWSMIIEKKWKLFYSSKHHVQCCEVMQWYLVITQSSLFTP